jgi:2-keto-4-pentenoate hydratase/2-oxohepta-3-ene-1,7-dioic acid hydratase in catechol pathway
MQLVQFQANDRKVRLGVVTGNRVIDLAAAARDSGEDYFHFESMLSLLRAGEAALAIARKLAAQSSSQTSSLELSGVKLVAPISRPGKIVAIGLNYRDHCKELGIDPPAVPIIFAKFPNSVTGPYDPIVLPGDDLEVDYEAELAVVIGRNAKRTSARQAMECVAGYLVLNDVSARKWQFADKQWVRGKSCDTFCPIGPWLTTKDDIPDPNALHISARVNGQTLQDSNTSNLIFGVPELIEFITASITLEPGDIIATGTPFGVGFSRKPPIYLKPDDVVEIEIERLGKLRNPVNSLGH